jgi:hypothetical protein
MKSDGIDKYIDNSSSVDDDSDDSFDAGFNGQPENQVGQNTGDPTNLIDIELIKLL